MPYKGVCKISSDQHSLYYFAEHGKYYFGPITLNIFV
jgi:hypothetical protein